MLNKKIIDWTRKQIAAGKKNKQLTKELYELGYTGSEVDEILKKAKASPIKEEKKTEKVVEQKHEVLQHEAVEWAKDLLNEGMPKKKLEELLFQSGYMGREVQAIIKEAQKQTKTTKKQPKQSVSEEIVQWCIEELEKKTTQKKIKEQLFQKGFKGNEVDEIIKKAKETPKKEETPKETERIPEDAIAWCQEQIDKGVSKKEVTEWLYQAGYMGKEVEEILGQVKTGKTKKKQQTPSSRVSKEVIEWCYKQLQTRTPEKKINEMLYQQGYTGKEVQLILKEAKKTEPKGKKEDKKEVLEWCQQQVKKGMPEKELEETLIKRGFTKKEVEELLEQTEERGIEETKPDRISPQVIEWCRDQLYDGTPTEQIKTLLFQRGYLGKEVEKILERAEESRTKAQVRMGKEIPKEMIDWYQKELKRGVKKKELLKALRKEGFTEPQIKQIVKHSEKGMNKSTIIKIILVLAIILLLIGLGVVAAVALFL